MLRLGLLCALLAMHGAASAGPSKEEIADAVRHLADCYVRTEGGKIEKALTADLKTMAFEKWSDGHNANCTLDVVKKKEVWPTLEGEALRNAVAESLFRRKYQNHSLADLSLVAPLGHEFGTYEFRYGRRATKKEIEVWTQQRRAAIYFSSLGECIVRAAPADVQRTLQTEPGTKEEAQSLAALHAPISACVDQSQTVKLDTSSLRGALALNYIRLAAAPRSQSDKSPGAVK